MLATLLAAAFGAGYSVHAGALPQMGRLAQDMFGARPAAPRVVRPPESPSRQFVAHVPRPPRAVAADRRSAPQGVAPEKTSAIRRPPEPVGRRAIALCGGGARVNCVVDGDTFYFGGEKIRIAGIDSPEIVGRCGSEKDLARMAKLRLKELLASGRVSLSRQGKDKYGRTLAVVSTGSGDISRVLISEGLARPWKGHKEDWC